MCLGNWCLSVNNICESSEAFDRIINERWSQWTWEMSRETRIRKWKARNLLRQWITTVWVQVHRKGKNVFCDVYRKINKTLDFKCMLVKNKEKNLFYISVFVPLISPNICRALLVSSRELSDLKSTVRKVLKKSSNSMQRTRDLIEIIVYKKTQKAVTTNTWHCCRITSKVLCLLQLNYLSIWTFHRRRYQARHFTDCRLPAYLDGIKSFTAHVSDKSVRTRDRNETYIQRKKIKFGRTKSAKNRNRFYIFGMM